MCNPNSLLVRVDTHSLQLTQEARLSRVSAGGRRRNFKVLLMKHAKRRDNGVPADRLEIINCDCPTRETVTCQKHDLFNCVSWCLTFREGSETCCGLRLTAISH
jgi:hypothetical protein